MRIYLAGKIRKNCWRHGIVRGNLDASGDRAKCGTTEVAFLKWPILERVIFDEHDYTGPFFVYCDHGCYHGSNKHGVGADCLLPDPKAPRDLQSSIRPLVASACLEAIRQADVVFAYIDDLTCHGTLAELGYAKALGKIIGITFPAHEPAWNDLWFVRQMADYQDGTTPAGIGDDLQATLDLATAEIPRRLRALPYWEYLKTPHWQRVREFALNRASRRCQVCNGTDRLQVHHRTYERRGCELDSDVIVLCNGCHEVFHKNGKLAKQ